jgi:hypothetical protein
MRRSTIGRRLALTFALVACAATASPLAFAANGASSEKGKPVAVTGSVSHVRGLSAELDGAVVPGTQTTSYYFQYGPTSAYGSQTTPGTLPPGSTRVKVAQTVTSFLPGYHYRLVATSLAGSDNGKDRTYTTKTVKGRFTVAKPTAPSVFGGPVAITGTLAGTGAANRKIVLQASPYPYLEPFSTVTAPIATNAAGAFVFHLATLSASTQFRVATLDPRPLYSSIVTEQVTVRVTLKVRTSKHKGLVRLYGTVTPAEVGARVFFQLRKAVRPGGKSERTTKFATQFGAVVKRGTRTTSRFSAIEEISRGGRYRAYVVVKKGALVPGSSSTVVLAAAPSKAKKKR